MFLTAKVVVVVVEEAQQHVESLRYRFGTSRANVAKVAKADGGERAARASTVSIKRVALGNKKALSPPLMLVQRLRKRTVSGYLIVFKQLCFWLKLGCYWI